MAVFSIPALKQELLTDPAGNGWSVLVSKGDMGAISSKLNVSNPALTAVSSSLSRVVVLSWLQVQGVLLTILSDTSHTSTAALRLFYNHPDLSVLNIQDQGFLSVINQLQVDGFLTPTQLQTLKSLWNETPCSYAESLWGAGVSVSWEQVLQALNS